jgi:F-type H+-transporting ATPase subunit a
MAEKAVHNEHDGHEAAGHDAHNSHPEHHPLDPHALFGHVEDSTSFHLPRAITPEGSHGHVEIPQPFADREPIFTMNTGNALLDRMIQPLDLKVTKFMVIELLVAILIAVFFIGLGRALKGGAIPRGRFRNMLEAMLLYFRDSVARPCIGRHDADRFVPFLWTIFFFVLGCNLFGMLPWMGSPTASLAVTGALAFVTFCVVIGSGMLKLGPVGFWKAQVPHMDLPPILKIFLVPMIFGIEIFGLIVKHGVLAVRLLANMMGGHVVLAVIIAFIGAATGAVWYAVTPASVVGATALSMLELFVAFLQAYIFTFLSALFIGMAVHPH